jgi:O-succinylbenzoic acid--CoA ligase
MKSFPCPLESAAQTHPHHLAVICGKKTITYTQLNSSVNQMVTHFDQEKLFAKEKAAILGQNSIEYTIILFALWRRGNTAVLLNTRLPQNRIRTQLKELNCTRLMIPQRQNLFFAPSKINTKKSRYAENQNATIMFTSGTSSAQPKAAVHSFGNHIYSAMGSNELITLHSNSRWLAALPFYHVGGLSIIFRVMLAKACVVIPKPDEKLIDVLRRYSLTHLSLVPTQLQQTLKNKSAISRLQKLKTILVGGSGIPQSLIEQSIKYKIPIRLTYGLTEMSSQVATSLIITPNPASRNVGVLRYRNVKIRNSEILVKGKTLFKGYFKNAKLSRPLTKDGWFRTADLGALSDGNGLRVLGRKDNMFISGGENIQPEEIEKTLLEIPKIEEAVVVAVSDAEFLNRPAAFLKFKNSTQLSTDRITKILSDKLPKFKIPDVFFAWPQMPNHNLTSKLPRKFFNDLLRSKFSRLSRLQ